MSTTFDGSTGPEIGVEPDVNGAPEARAWSPAADTDGPDSLLDQLRDRITERDETEPSEWIKEIPKVGIRLVCNPDIDNSDFQRWMKQSSPRGRRGGRGSNPMDMDQLQLSARALISQCLRVEIRRGEQWRAMTGRDGDVLALDSNELMRSFSVMDAVSVLRKLFGRDSRVIDAGQELIAEAGYMGDDDDPV